MPPKKGREGSRGRGSLAVHDELTSWDNPQPNGRDLYAFLSDHRTGCITAPKAAMAQMNNSMARAMIRKKAALMSWNTGSMVSPSLLPSY
jgi:hypothetical protein